MLAAFEPQSSAAPWEETIQLLDGADRSPLWAAVPSDLVLTLTIIEDVGAQRAAPAASIIALSTDATDRIRADVNGFILIAVDESELAALAPVENGVNKRYLVYLKAELEGQPTQVFVGVLPIYLGH